ncbi:rRNA maturation RNase YbeY [Phenylobacterium aquaticum]|uniref:rRNA maturation RNase YbeY n=1 Tax=Phenylobacterium aquaticum TaxID=1763816 RepID=UPI0026EEA750|nr:rRNA maturation RNase YbeY [Phenylobacterium aquaticum]
MIDIEIEDERWSDVLPEASALVLAAAEAALAGAQRAGVVVVLLTDDKAQHALNLQFRGKDSSTNVLSFPAPENPEDHLGDISLAFEVCAAEARDQAKPFAHHLQHLVAHGVLHLVGYDHETDAEALEMEGLEREVLAGLGVPDPYAAERGDDGQF